MKKIAALILSLIMSVSCISVFAESDSGKGYLSTFDVASAGDVTLDVMITSLGDSDGGPYLRGVMQSYMDMYPNVKLNPVECSMNNLYTTLITRATSNTLPDIFTMSEAYYANCYEMDMAVTNLDELLGAEYVSNLLPIAIENATINGTLVYMPWQNNTTAVVYRKDLFEAEGIEIPKTWDEYIEAAKKLTKDTDGDGRNDQFGAVVSGTRNDSAESRFHTFALTFGMNFLNVNEDGTFSSGFDTPAFTQAMDTYVKLGTGETAPAGFVETGYAEAYKMIAAGTACMYWSASNVLGGIYTSNPDMIGKMGSFMLPTAEGIAPVTSFSSVGMTIAKTCKHPEVAADFLKYMTSVENSVAWNQATRRLPVVKDAIEAIVAADEAYAGFADAGTTAVIYPAFAGTAELRDTVGECWQRIASEGVSLEAAVKDAVARAAEIVESYQ